MVSTAGATALKATIAGLCAGLTAIAITILVEKFGGIVGGILGTIPTTIVPSAIGIALTANKDTQKLRNAMYSVPLGMLLNSCFLYLWRVIPSAWPRRWSKWKNLLMTIAVTVVAWLIGACGCFFLLRLLKDKHMNLLWAGLTAWIVNLVGGLLLVLLQPLPAPKGKKPVRWPVLLCRGSLACAAVACAVTLSALNPIVAGIASTFPAIFLTTMVSLGISQDHAVSLGATGPMIVGSLSVGAFAMGFGGFVPYMQRRISSRVGGIAVGTVVIYVCSVVGITLPIFVFMMWWRRVQQRNKKSCDPRVGVSSESSNGHVVQLRSMLSTGTLEVPCNTSSTST